VKRRAPVVFFVVAAALVMVACGARVVPLTQGPGGASAYVDPLTGATIVPTPGQSGFLPPGATPSTQPSASLSPILPGCTPGRGDIGVSKDTIKIGLIASITGPLPGQFDSAVQAVDAYFRGVNEAGGICGRRIQLIIANDNGNQAQNRALAERMSKEDKVFAFVGSHSAPDDSGLGIVSKRDKIPDIGFSLTWTRAENPYSFSVPGQVQRAWIGEGASGSKWLNEELDIKQIAIFWLRESEVSILSAWAFEAAMIRVTKRDRGTPIKVCHEQPAGVVDTNYTSYVISMKGHCDPADGNIAVYTTMENNANINLAKAMKEQGFKYTAYAPTFSSYLPSFISQANGATEGAYLAMPQIPFERLDRPTSEWTPGTYELKRYADTLQRFYPRPKPPGSFGGPAWGQAALFVETAKRCGADLTRACLLKQINSVGAFSTGGFTSPTDPKTHKVYTQDLLVQVRGGRFVEVRPQDKSGPPGGPDFWDVSDLFNWWDFFCAGNNRQLFPRPEEKEAYIDDHRDC
jgi:branched-chain amino acid transport system substrate-binding protein